MAIPEIKVKLTAANRLSSGLTSARNSLNNFGRSGRRLQSQFADIGSGIGASLAASIGGALSFRGLTRGVTAAANMQEALNVSKQNLFDSTKSSDQLAKDIKKVEQSSIRIAKDAPFAAKDVVEISNELIKLGLGLDDITQKGGAAFSTTALASIFKEDISPKALAESFGKTGALFDLRGKEFSKGADIISRVSTAAATNFKELLFNLQLAGPAARLLKLPFEETVIALGALAPLSKRAGEAFAGFLRDAKGIDEFFDDEGEFVGIPAAIKLLKDELEGLSTKEAAEKLSDIFKEDVAAKAAAIFITTGKTFEDIQESTKNSASLIQKMQFWAEGLNASMEKVQGTSESTLGTVFKPWLDDLTAITNKVNEWISLMGQLAEKHQNLTKALGGAGVAVIGGLGILGAGSLIKKARGALSGGGGVTAAKGPLSPAELNKAFRGGGGAPSAAGPGLFTKGIVSAAGLAGGFAIGSFLREELKKELSDPKLDLSPIQRKSFDIFQDLFGIIPDPVRPTREAELKAQQLRDMNINIRIDNQGNPTVTTDIPEAVVNVESLTSGNLIPREARQGF